MKYVIEAEHISKIFGALEPAQSTGMAYADAAQAIIRSMIDTRPRTVALDDVSLQVSEGDFVCIMGPSGSGKTTLLNVLSTIDKPTKGKIFIQGENVRKMGEIAIGDFRNKYLGFIFQKFNLLDNLTIFENIAMPLSIAHEKTEVIKERVEEIAKKVGIEELLDKYPTQCSGGQCQRCAVARSLVAQPKLIVADEPTGNLDSKNSHEILKLLKRLNEEEGVTILLVTHDSMIASYAKQLLFLEDGKIATVVERGEDSQKGFYHRIMEITSKEGMAFLES